MCMNTSDIERTPSPGRQPYFSWGTASARSITFLAESSSRAKSSARNPAGGAAAWVAGSAALVAGSAASAGTASANRTAVRISLRVIFVFLPWMEPPVPTASLSTV